MRSTFSEMIKVYLQPKGRMPTANWPVPAIFILWLFLRPANIINLARRSLRTHNAKGDFSLNDFWHSDASRAWRSKAPTTFYPLKKTATHVMAIIPFNFAVARCPRMEIVKWKVALKEEAGSSACLRVKTSSSWLTFLTGELQWVDNLCGNEVERWRRDR